VPQGTHEAVGEEFRRTIDECRGAVGEKKRMNAHNLRIEFSKAWKKGGTAKRAIHSFLEQYVHG
jgi:hypothetical protein